MTRYIDADAYIKYCEDKWIPLNVDAVTEQPTADVVEVVRCKDCKHYESDGGAMMVCSVFDWYANDGNDYCSHGERRE